MDHLVEALFVTGAKAMRAKIALGDLDHARFCDRFSIPEARKDKMGPL
jgi:hypothetical protein